MDILLTIMAAFAILGLLDDLLGGKLGLAPKFHIGLSSMGSLAIAYAGFYCIGTALIQQNATAIADFTSGMPFDPSLIIGALICSDSGGLPIALELARTPALGVFTGSLIGSGLGLTIGFQMPVFMSSMDKEHIPSFMQGMGYGIIALPVGLIVGGLTLGLSVPELIANTLPIAIICAVLVVSFRMSLDKTVKVLTAIANFIRIITYVFFALVIVGIFVPSLAIADPKQVESVMYTVLRTTVVMCGGLVIAQLVTRYCKKPLALVTKLLKINEASIIGLLISSVSAVAMIPFYRQMDKRGKVMNAAFCVCGSFILGGQMAFNTSILTSEAYATVVPTTSVLAFMLNKLICGVLAVVIASFLVKPEETK